MIAVGVSAFSALDKVSARKGELQSSDPAQRVEQSSSNEAEANKGLSNIPDERPSSFQSTTNEDEQISSTTPKKPVAKYFIFPLVGEVIKKFSATELLYSVTFNDMRLHTGIDIKADKGAEVKAVGDGTVLEVMNDPNLGYTVRIDHGNGVVVAYAGLDKEVLVEVEEIVSAETVIGTVGTVNNECLDASHLHLEFLKDAKFQDPLDFLK